MSRAWTGYRRSEPLETPNEKYSRRDRRGGGALLPAPLYGSFRGHPVTEKFDLFLSARSGRDLERA